MTVTELIDLLKTFDPDSIVILSKDEEGNGFNPLEAAEPSHYQTASDGEGNRIGLKALTPELIDQGYSEDDVLPDSIPAIVLWPKHQ